MIHTSETDPIRLDPICQHVNGGILYVTFAPGKTQIRKRKRSWRRNLDLDLERISQVYQTKYVVCLLPNHELQTLKISDYPEKAKEYGITLIRFPVEDYNVPVGFEGFHELIQMIDSILASGNHVMVHCCGGLGRAGTVASGLLCYYGYTPDNAFQTVQQGRYNSIKRKSQQKYVRDYAQLLLDSS